MRWCGSLLFLLVAADVAAQPVTQPTSQPASQPAAGSRLELIYSGGTGGLGSSSSSGSTIVLLWDHLTARGGGTQITATGVGCLRRGRRLLIDPEVRRLDHVLDAVREPTTTRRVLARDLPVLESDHVIVFQYPKNPDLDLLRMMEQRNEQTRRGCTAGSGCTAACRCTSAGPTAGTSVA